MARKPKDSDDIRDDRTPEAKEDADILSEAKDRYQRVADYESDFRSSFAQDVKFVHADPDNHAQWPDEVYNQRTSDTNRRPTMTANITWNIANFIINSTRMNLPSVTIKPTGDQSTFKSAEAYEALIRNIQYRSQAPAIYIDAHSHQVWGGVGYFRVVTRWDEENPEPDASAWNQSIFLEPVQSQLGVALDPAAKQKSGSDAKWGFVFEDVPRDQFKRDYPNIDPPTFNPLDKSDSWVTEDTIRVAEYYRITSDPDEMVYISDKDETGKEITSIVRMSEAPAGFAKALKISEQDGATVKRRKIWRNRLQWFKIVGNKIVDRNLQLPGKGNFVPIVRVLGREVKVNGRMDRKGVVRMLKDTQRLFNYYLSTDAEFNALQPKSPFIGYKESFEGNEPAWNKLNISNPAFLPVNMVSEEIDGPIPLPQRQSAPTDAPAYRNGMQMAMAHMALISGIPDANFGRQTNEQSGLAVKERRRGGDSANYDFADALAEAVAYAGRIMVDWIPDVYDIERTIKVMARDGTQSEVTIAPKQGEALVEQEKNGDDIARVLFDPAVGKYEVVSEVGPSYATQREDAWEAFTGIVTRSPELMGIFGDLLFMTADFPMSDKVAERMREQIRATAPWLLGEGVPPMVQELHGKLGELQKLNEQLLEHIGKQARMIEDKTRDNERKEFEAQSRAEREAKDADSRQEDALSKRITAVSNAQPELDRTGAKGAFDDLLQQTFQLAEKTAFDAEKFGAKRAKDGNWYMPDPDRAGKYLQVG